MHVLVNLSTSFIFFLIICLSGYPANVKAMENDEIRFNSINYHPSSALIDANTQSAFNYIQDIFENNDKEVSACRKYNISIPNDDNQNMYYQPIFMREMDVALFGKTRSRPAILLGLVAGCVGPVAAILQTGLTLYSIGDVLHLPPRQLGAELMITWMMITYAPGFANQMYDRTMTIIESLRRKQIFVLGDGDLAARPRDYPVTKLHMLGKVVTLLAASVDATFYWGAISLAYEKVPVAIWGLGWAFWLVNCERYYKVGIENLNRLSVNTHNDETEMIKIKRKYLLLQNKKLELAISQNDDLVRSLFHLVKGEINNDSEIRIFRTGALFLKEGPKLSFSEFEDKNIDRTSQPVTIMSLLQKITELENKLKLSQAEILGSSPVNTILTSGNTSLYKEGLKAGASNITNAVLTGAAVVGNVIGYQYILGEALGQFSIDSATSSAIAWGLSGSLTVFTSVVKYYLRTKYIESMFNIFSFDHLVHWKLFRKTIGAASLVNGSFGGLAKVMAILGFLDKYNAPESLQVMLTIAPFLTDKFYFSEYNNDELQSLLTKLATFRSDAQKSYFGKPGICEQRAYLKKYCKKLQDKLELYYNATTIETLYHKIFIEKEGEEAA